MIILQKLKSASNVFWLILFISSTEIFCVLLCVSSENTEINNMWSFQEGDYSLGMRESLYKALFSLFYWMSDRNHNILRM